MEIKAKAEHGIVHRAKNTLFAYEGWGSICRDEAGVLYAVSSGMRLGHVCPFGKTVMYISRNEGKTWTPPIVIHDDYLDDRDAGILYMGKGRMLVSWFSHSRAAYVDYYARYMKEDIEPEAKDAVVGMLGSYKYIPEEYSHGGSYVIISEDYGVTWSDPVKLPVSAPHGPALCKDGSLVYLGKDMYITEENNNTDGNIRAYKSRDGGCSWSELAVITFPDGTVPRNFHEPHVIELPDGRLYGVIRAEGGEVDYGFTMYFTESSDGGNTWTVPAKMGVCGSPPHLMLHSSGALICCYGRRAEPVGERALVSYDLGKTWQDDYIINDLAPDGDMGYPASVELDDGSIFTVYYQKLQGDKKCSLLYSRWRLER